MSAFQIKTMHDLGLVHEALAEWQWHSVAVADTNGAPYLLAEHEDGELYFTAGTEEGWIDAAFLIKYYAPITLLSPLNMTETAR